MARQQLHVGEWRVQPDLNRIIRGDDTVHLEPRIMDLLVTLAQHPLDVLSKRRLFDLVWPEQYVADAVLTRAVGELRRALGDDSRSPRYLETIHKRGYRLVAEVRWPEESSGACAEAPVVTAMAGAPCCLRIGEREVPLAVGTHIIGRSPEADIQLCLAKVSRMHAQVDVGGGTAAIIDLGSKNGTFVRGRRVHGPHTLEDGDQILVGTATLVFRDLLRAPTETQEGSSGISQPS